MTLLTVLFLLFLSIQLVFWIGIFGRFVFLFEEKESTLVAKNQAVSVLICAKNEAENLQKFLPLWLGQSHPNYEVLVINDRSTDQTSVILSQLSEKYTHLRVLDLKTKPENYDGKKYAIEQGMRQAKHDLILLTDADCYPKSPTNLQERAGQFDEKTNFVLGYSPYKFMPTWLNFMIQYETLYTALQYFSMAFLGNPYMAVGRNLGYRQQLFWAKNGFDKTKHLTGGDDDLLVNQYAHQSTTRVVIHPDSQVVSMPEMSWRAWFHQKKRHLSAGKSYHLKDQIWSFVLFLSQFMCWICLVCGIFFWENQELIRNLGGFLMRQGIILLILSRLAQRLGSRLPLKFVFVLEFLYILYYLYTGIISLISKKIAWKIKNDDSFRTKH